MRKLKAFLLLLPLFLVPLFLVPLLPAMAHAAEVAPESPAQCPLTASPAPPEEVIGLLLAWLPATWEGWATLAVAVCAVIAATLPRPREDAHVLWRGLYALINALGANFGRAINADDKAAKLGRLARLGRKLKK